MSSDAATASLSPAGTATGAVAGKKDSLAEVMAASMVGTAIEFYDNYCYSIAAATYFAVVFFPQMDAVLGTLYSLVTFAVSFLARPFGSLLFGHFGDKLGRKKTLVVALMMMGIATFVVGILPGFATLGAVSVVLLCVCRACQGIGLAGEWSGAALVATENAPSDKRAMYGSFPNLGAPIGFFFAYGINLVLTTALTQDQMLAFGWRIPFLLSALLVIVGLIVRLRMSETPVYRKAAAENRVSKTPLRDMLKFHWKQVLLGTFAMGITYTLFYTLGTWSLSYGVKSLGFAQNEYLVMLMVGAIFFAVFILVGCKLADVHGRKVVLLAATGATFVFGFLFPLFLSSQHNVPLVLAFICLGFVCMGVLFGPCGAYLPELFPTKVRYSGAGFSYNLAAILGGAFTPYIATLLVANFGIASVGWFLSFMALLALVALLLFKETKHVDYEH